MELATTLEENPAVKRFQEMAKELDVVIPVSFFERAGNAAFNSIAIIDADGTVLGKYRKTHIPDGMPYAEKFFFTPLRIQKQIIRLPVRIFVLTVLIHQRIIRSPPKAEKSPALSVHHEIPDIILSTQGKIRIQNSFFVKLPQISQSCFRLLSQRSVNNLTIFSSDPLLWISAKAFENVIHGITGAGRSHKPRITDKPDRFLTILCTHSIFLKSLYHRKSLLQSFRFCQAKLFDPVMAEPQKLRTMINGSFRKCKKLPVKSPGFQKFISIAFIHLPDPV